MLCSILTISVNIRVDFPVPTPPIIRAPCLKSLLRSSLSGIDVGYYIVPMLIEGPSGVMNSSSSSDGLKTGVSGGIGCR